MKPHAATLGVRHARLFVTLVLLRGGLAVVLPIFWFFRILIAAGLLARIDFASRLARRATTAADAAMEMALARPRRCSC